MGGWDVPSGREGFHEWVLSSSSSSSLGGGGLGRSSGGSGGAVFLLNGWVGGWVDEGFLIGPLYSWVKVKEKR